MIPPLVSSGRLDSRTARSLGLGWMAIGLVLTAAGWTSDSNAWTWILLLSGFVVVAWGVRRIAQAERTAE